MIKLKISEYKDNDYFLDNYTVPKIEDVKFEKKNNLIIILLESMSNNLHLSDDTTSYIPKLQSLYTKYQHHGQLYNCRNTTWTIAALTSWCYGVPLNLPNIGDNCYNAGNFLPNAASIFDILKKNDYSSYLFMGSSAQFAGTNYLFERGDYTVCDVEYFRAQNRITDQNYSNWGLYDFFLYDELYKKYLELRGQDKPFVLFMQTIDTHNPGFTPENKVQYGDIRDSWLNADDMLYTFIKKMEPFLETDNVTILIFGDHNVMGKKYGTPNAQDSLFNLFVGKNMPQIPESKLTQNINPMDIAPTILQAAGAKWNNDQFGLGISIFSKAKSFSEREGREGLDEKLLYHSKFYDNFFRNGFDKFYGELRKALKENSVDFKKFYNEKGFTDEQAYIAHGSGVNEYTYTNSYEGMLDSLQKGFKFIELDLLVTTDNVIIGGHDWSYFKNLIGYSDDSDSAVLYEEIKDKKINNKYSILSSKEICAVMEKYPDFYLVTDKIQNYSLLLEQIPFPDRMIVEVFSLTNYYDALKAGIKYPALCVDTAEAARNALDLGIPMYTGNIQKMVDNPKFLEYVTKAHKDGAVIFLFGYGKTVSSRYFMKRFMGKAFSKFYVDRDYHEIIEKNLK